jgi:Xaa-Pro aminopeptidase
MVGGQPPVYTLAERDRRWALARTVMAAEGVDALVVYGEHEWAGPAPFGFDVYFTNSRPGSIFVLPRVGDPVVLVWGPAHIADDMQARRRGDTCWLSPKSLRVAEHAPGVVQVLRELGLERAAIGVIGLDPYPPFHLNSIMPYQLWHEVLETMPHAVFRSVWTEFVLRAMVHSHEELAAVRYAANAGQRVAAAIEAAVRPGVSEMELYAQGVYAGVRHGIATPAVLLGSGPETISWGPPVWSYRPQSARTVGEGDVVVAEVSCSYGMQESRHPFTVAVGQVHPEVNDAAQVARASYDAGLATLRPGVTFGEVVARMRAPIQQAGGWLVRGLVHGLNPYSTICGFGAGLRTLPEAAAYGLLADIPTVGHDVRLAPGMTFVLAPNCAFGRRMARFGGTVVVGRDGPIELSPSTARLLRT